MQERREDIAAVRAVMDDYVKGSSGDVELLRSIFHPNALMNGYFKGNLGIGSPEPFFEIVAAMEPGNKNPDYHAEIESIDVIGEIATAKLVEVGFLGTNFIDVFHLIRVDGAWKIISKTYHQAD